MRNRSKKRLEELQAAAPAKRKKADIFVKVPIWWVTEATRLTRTPAALVCIHLLLVSWKTRSTTFPFPNGRLKGSGVSREVKRRVLRDLEAGGLIKVERRPGKTPIVTLVVL
jgi:hypothetical protein